jgi:hypothetical protein
MALILEEAEQQQEARSIPFMLEASEKVAQILDCGGLWMYKVSLFPHDVWQTLEGFILVSGPLIQPISCMKICSWRDKIGMINRVRSMNAIWEN